MDPLIVTSMLTAIQDFVTESFGASKPLELIECGDRSLLIKKGTFVVAITILGSVTNEIRGRLNRAYDQLQTEFGSSLSNLEDPPTHLQSKLQKRLTSYLSSRRLKHPIVRPWHTAMASLLSASVVWGTISFARSPAGNSDASFVTKALSHNSILNIGETSSTANEDEPVGKWQSDMERDVAILVASLNDEVDIEVSRYEANPDGRIAIHGFRDYYGVEPSEIAKLVGLDPQRFEFDFQLVNCAHPEFVRKRIIARVNRLNEASRSRLTFNIDETCICFEGIAKRIVVEQLMKSCQRSLHGYRVDVSQVEIE